MKTNKITKPVAAVVLLCFFLNMILLSPNSFSQSIEQSKDKIGGSSSTVQQEDSKNDNTFLYIAAGVIVVGLIVWKVFLDKKETKAKQNTQTDSTKVSTNEIDIHNPSKELMPEQIPNEALPN
jgi:hypothetical protein